MIGRGSRIGVLGSRRLTVILSAGRCGTQWLADTLLSIYTQSVEVQHEPLGPLYAPRRYFRRYDHPEAVLDVPEVRRHVERIGALERYVETGWPLFGALPLLAERFADRLRVVHLTRHPVPNALSHLAHSSYAGSARDDAYTRLATLGPDDPNVFQPQYAKRWDRLSPYEKCLFWWTEVHLFGLEFQRRYPRIPFLRVKSEDMLAGDPDVLDELAGHMGLPPDERWKDHVTRRVDRWNHRTDRDFDPFELRDHPATIDLARRLGYCEDDVDVEALRARYSGRPHAGADRVGRFSS